MGYIAILVTSECMHALKSLYHSARQPEVKMVKPSPVAEYSTYTVEAIVADKPLADPAICSHRKESFYILLS